MALDVVVRKTFQKKCRKVEVDGFGLADSPNLRGGACPLEFAGQAGLVSRMNKIEIAAGLRQEVGELEAAIKKLQARCERLKTFVLNLEAEIAAAEGKTPAPAPAGKFRQVIDQVFGEQPKRSRR